MSWQHPDKGKRHSGEDTGAKTGRPENIRSLPEGPRWGAGVPGQGAASVRILGQEVLPPTCTLEPCVVQEKPLYQGFPGDCDMLPSWRSTGVDCRVGALQSCKETVKGSDVGFGNIPRCYNIAAKSQPEPRGA